MPARVLKPRFDLDPAWRQEQSPGRDESTLQRAVGLGRLRGTRARRGIRRLVAVRTVRRMVAVRAVGDTPPGNTRRTPIAGHGIWPVLVDGRDPSLKLVNPAKQSRDDRISLGQFRPDCWAQRLL